MDIHDLVESLRSETKGFSTEKLVAYLVQKLGVRVGLATSFGAEDQVLADIICKTSAKPKVFTLDTGRLPQETYDVMEQTRKRYGIKIEILFPDYKQVEQMVNEYGPNLFYDNVENRKLCCRIRKVEPLKRCLANFDAWICGLRAEQSTTREKLQKIEVDETFGLVKVNPLADWTTEQVWKYIRQNDVPYNKLHDEGYPSIGCAPCTRAVKPGEDIRAGRWWWEEPEHKECGLHLKADSVKKKV